MPNQSFPIRAITSGPLNHWFGYYDKLQVGPSNRYALGMAVDFEHRSPTEKDAIKIGLIDLEDEDLWTPLGETQTWCWQQGCMLQWRPGSDCEVMWNDRAGSNFVCRIYNLKSHQTRTSQQAIYTISPDGQTAIGTDFRRINDMRPGYGYAGIADPFSQIRAPKDSGIYTVNLDSGVSQQVISIAEIAATPYPHRDLVEAKHYFNHLLFNPDGTRFTFLHRWRFEDSGFQTRMLTANIDGSDIHVVDDYGKMSHFIWRDPNHILGWAFHPIDGNRFYLFKDRSGEPPVAIGVDEMAVNGHCSYLPGNQWILNDTYPGQQGREQTLYVYNVQSGHRINLGVFPSPQEYAGEWRCDLHPRFSPDGKSVLIDSAHAGHGRQMYLIDIGSLSN